LSHHRFESQAAGQVVSYHIYQPDAYAQAPDVRFPVVYWLHGSGGGLPGVAALAERFDAAITSGRAPPFLAVFVNGLPNGMYVDWKDGSRPVESMIVSDLIPHIDQHWRTIATRQGRLLDGFSMGGYGAARLGFKFPELFGAISIMGAGPLQEDLTRDAPLAGRARAQEVFMQVYGGDQDYFDRVSPRRLAEANAARLRDGRPIRVVIGDRDPTFAQNELFHDHLLRWAIAHEWVVLAGVGHNPARVLDTLADEGWRFYRTAFAPTAPAGGRDGQSAH
jgi:S-formylglutathione hydrolase FrmB